MYFDRFDICAAYHSFVFAFGSHSGELMNFERKVMLQLARLQYRPSILSNFAPSELTDNGKVIYMSLVRRYFTR